MLLLDERIRTGFDVDVSRKHGVSLSSMDVKLLQNVADEDEKN